MKLPKLTRPNLDVVYNYSFPFFWGDAGNAEAIASIGTSARGLAGSHFADNLLTWGRNNSMFDDGEFVKAWRDNAESDSDRSIVWRRYILACAGYHCVQLEGDFVECGAYTGVGMKTVMDYLGGKDFPKAFWGYDMFEHGPELAHHSMPEHGPKLFERVSEKFTGYSGVRIVRGAIPEVFAGNSPEKISYLHIDLNEAPAEIAALDQLFHRVVPSGMIILDDYEWGTVYRGQKLAEDPWFEARGYRVMPLPTGQGLIIKR